MAREVKQLSKDESPGRGGKTGGKVVASEALSAAAIAKLLSGIVFPKDKDKVIEYAKQNKIKLDRPEQVIDTLKEILDRTYHNTAEVERGIRKYKIR